MPELNLADILAALNSRLDLVEAQCLQANMERDELTEDYLPSPESGEESINYGRNVGFRVYDRPNDDNKIHPNYKRLTEGQVYVDGESKTESPVNFADGVYDFTVSSTTYTYIKYSISAGTWQVVSGTTAATADGDYGAGTHYFCRLTTHTVGDPSATIVHHEGDVHFGGGTTTVATRWYAQDTTPTWADLTTDVEDTDYVTSQDSISGDFDLSGGAVWYSKLELISSVVTLINWQKCQPQ